MTASGAHIAARTCATARPQLAKADTAFQGASVSQPTEPCLGEQIGASLREPDERSTLVHHQPALDRQLQTSTIFGRRCALPKQERRVDLLDGDAAVRYRLGGVGDLKELARRLFGIAIRPVSGEFHMPSLSRE